MPTRILLRYLAFLLRTLQVIMGLNGLPAFLTSRWQTVKRFRLGRVKGKGVGGYLLIPHAGFFYVNAFAFTPINLRLSVPIGLLKTYLFE